MESTTFTFKAHDEKEIFVYKWAPRNLTPKAIMLVIHGLAEHGARYERFAKEATNTGYILYVPDLRGHGKTAGSASELGVIDYDGWNSIVNDLHILTNLMKKENPGLSLFVFGHSLGSEILQDYLQRWGSEVKAAILCGIQSQQPFYILLFGEALGKGEIKKLGGKAPSKTFHKMAWEKFNKPFKPTATDYDWISTDSAEVKKYADDNLCGWTPSTVFAMEITKGFKKIHKKSNRELIPNDLPIHVIYGSQDASNNFGKWAKIAVKKYKALGKNISSKVYEGKRHELLNEVNRVEVTHDILNWFDLHL